MSKMSDRDLDMVTGGIGVAGYTSIAADLEIPIPGSPIDEFTTVLVPGLQPASLFELFEDFGPSGGIFTWDMAQPLNR